MYHNTLRYHPRLVELLFAVEQLKRVLYSPWHPKTVGLVAASINRALHTMADGATLPEIDRRARNAKAHEVEARLEHHLPYIKNQAVSITIILLLVGQGLLK